MTKPFTSIRSVDDLIASGLVDENDKQITKKVVDRYPVAITPTMAALIEPSDHDDPIAKQFVPSAEELNHHPEERADAIGDNLKSPAKGVVHRYPDRALLKLVSVCPLYCRFCFRREMIGAKHHGVLSPEDFYAAIGYFKSRKELWEVIITGGDPLILSPRRISEVTAALSNLVHIRVLRWHTRVPVVLPEHVTDDLISAMATTSKTVYVSIHANHAREFTAEALAACKRMHAAGLHLVSQSVLLRGINDDADTLCELMRTLVEAGIKPYYLHHPDLAPGTSHFRVAIKKGQALMRELRQRLSGLAQPTYVLDIPGAHGKVPIGPQFVSRANNKNYSVTDPSSGHHSYLDCCRGE